MAAAYKILQRAATQQPDNEELHPNEDHVNKTLEGKVVNRLSQGEPFKRRSYEGYFDPLTRANYRKADLWKCLIPAKHEEFMLNLTSSGTTCKPYHGVALEYAAILSTQRQCCGQPHNMKKGPGSYNQDFSHYSRFMASYLPEHRLQNRIHVNGKRDRGFKNLRNRSQQAKLCSDISSYHSTIFRTTIRYSDLQLTLYVPPCPEGGKATPCEDHCRLILSDGHISPLNTVTAINYFAQSQLWFLFITLTLLPLEAAEAKKKTLTCWSKTKPLLIANLLSFIFLRLSLQGLERIKLSCVLHKILNMALVLIESMYDINAYAARNQYTFDQPVKRSTYVCRPQSLPQYIRTNWLAMALIIKIQHEATTNLLVTEDLPITTVSVVGIRSASCITAPAEDMQALPSEATLDISCSCAGRVIRSIYLGRHDRVVDIIAHYSLESLPDFFILIDEVLNGPDIWVIARERICIRILDIAMTLKLTSARLDPRPNASLYLITELSYEGKEPGTTLKDATGRITALEPLSMVQQSTISEIAATMPEPVPRVRMTRAGNLPPNTLCENVCLNHQSVQRSGRQLLTDAGQIGYTESRTDSKSVKKLQYLQSHPHVPRQLRSGSSEPGYFATREESKSPKVALLNLKERSSHARFQSPEGGLFCEGHCSSLKHKRVVAPTNFRSDTQMTPKTRRAL
ncbi:hypothetical protein RF11_04968 [Thelohanellus kitauei]|uniref:Uncharacterized protein n=1 Tax=Thelohanellus kitauei TaxID=669202 RepID=A0A0C2JXU2_THEKT|nr:hypothetical protein RF11_04968 [Thelohanellus kitauei]